MASLDAQGNYHTIVQYRPGEQLDHIVRGFARYASGDRVVLLDCPWFKGDHDPIFTYATAVTAIREVNAKQFLSGGQFHNPNGYYTVTSAGILSPWRTVYGPADKILQGVTGVAVGQKAKVKNRAFTRLDPADVPDEILLAHPSSAASW